MASIRRTLSPYHQNGGVGNTSPFSLNSPTSHKHTQTSRFASLIEKPRKGSLRTWRRSIYTCLLFFLAGFLLGLAPFGQFDQQQDADFSFETLNRPPPLDTTNIVVNKVALAVETKDENSENKDRFDYIARKQLIVVTPTYNRALQAFYLNRLGHVLRLVPPPVLWIVVEMNVASTETADILRGMGIMYRHLVCGKNLTDIKDRGVHQRNTALEHIEHHKLDGIVYFADDDNVYSLELFETLRDIRYVLLCFLILLSNNVDVFCFLCWILIILSAMCAYDCEC